MYACMHACMQAGRHACLLACNVRTYVCAYACMHACLCARRADGVVGVCRPARSPPRSNNDNNNNNNDNDNNTGTWRRQIKCCVHLIYIYIYTYYTHTHIFTHLHMGPSLHADSEPAALCRHTQDSSGDISYVSYVSTVFTFQWFSYFNGFHMSLFTNVARRHFYKRSSPTLNIHQRGVQWKEGVVIYVMLYTSLFVYYYPHPLHPPPTAPPAMNTRKCLA